MDNDSDVFTKSQTRHTREINGAFRSLVIQEKTEGLERWHRKQRCHTESRQEKYPKAK